VGLFGFTASGQGLVLAKWPQKPFASTASQKHTEKMAQLRLDESSFGTELDSWSESEVDAEVD
jgi:hypothetical protein